MKAVIENFVNQKDDREMLDAVNQSFGKDETVDTFWEDFKNCNFKNHFFGRGSNHIWIKNKRNVNQRVILITN